MTGVALIIAFVLAIIVMIVAISKFKVHPFLAIMAVSLILAMMAGIPFVDTVKPDGTKVSGIPTVIGAGFSGTFSSIGIVIILGALIGSVLEKTGAAYCTNSDSILYNGPFVLSEWDGTSDTWKLEKNEEYYDAKEVKL